MIAAFKSREAQSKLARDIHVPHRRVNEIVLGKRNVTPDTPMRFSADFGTTAEFWMSLQITYDLMRLQLLKGEKYQKILRVSEAA